MRTMKAMAIVLGSTMFLGGCLGQAFSMAISALPGSILTELVIDNNDILDLFVDG